MEDLSNHQDNIATDGFSIINDMYTAVEVEDIIRVISLANQSNPTFRKTEDLFAIRRF